MLLCLANVQQQHQRQTTKADGFDSRQFGIRESRVAVASRSLQVASWQLLVAGLKNRVQGMAPKVSLACSVSAANIVTNYMRHKMKETAQSSLGAGGAWGSKHSGRIRN